jgi:hypothetical protein
MLEIILIILLIVLIVMAFVILYYIRQHSNQKSKQKDKIIDTKTAKNARLILRELRSKFESYYRRPPTKNELVRLIIMTSHVIEDRTTLKSHWRRWRIRLFLAAENHVWYGAKPANTKTIAGALGTVK